MTIIGIIIFFIGWIYAISTFGFFLGLGLGWIPALFVAWILDFFVVLIKGTTGSNQFGPDPTKGSAATPKAVVRSDDSVLYGQAYGELEEGSMDKAVWAKAFADENGNEARAKALYIKRRVATLTERKQKKERDNAAMHQAAQQRERIARLAALSTNDAFELLRQNTDGKAQVFAELRGSVWVCICGAENSYAPEKSIQNCSTCGINRDFALSHWSEEAMKEKLADTEQSD